MKSRFACLALALALWPTAAAAERAVVLNDGVELARGYCEGRVSASTDTTTTLAIDACHDGGIKGIAPGQSHTFPKAEVHAAKPGLAMADARKRFFASPRIVAILRGGYMPTPGDDFSTLAALADKAGLSDWHAFIGLLQPIAVLEKLMYAKRLTDYTAQDFAQAMDAYDRYAVAEQDAIHAYARATARRPIAGHRLLPDRGASILLGLARGTYDLPMNMAMPDAWLKLQLRAAGVSTAMLKAYRLAMTPMGLNPFFVTETKKLQRSDAEIRQAAERTYTRAARFTVLGVLSDAEYAKPDGQILADVKQALLPYTHARRASMATARAKLAYARKQIAATERTLAAMEGRHWQLTLKETDGDPPHHFVMVFTRTGVHALEAKIYQKDLQYGNLIPVLTWPVYVQGNGDILVNSAVNGPVDNAFIIPAAAFARGHFKLRSLGSSEVFFASGVLHRNPKTH